MFSWHPIFARMVPVRLTCLVNLCFGAELDQLRFLNSFTFAV